MISSLNNLKSRREYCPQPLDDDFFCNMELSYDKSLTVETRQLSHARWKLMRHFGYVRMTIRIPLKITSDYLLRIRHPLLGSLEG